MENLLYLPVSIGEAIDKLTILDIKLEMINDNRRIEVKKEYNLLLEKLKPFLELNINLYNAMKKINLVIWNQMDQLRDHKIDNDEYFKLCKECIEFNDIRFRIKNKINQILNSSLKEQKGYKIKSLHLNINQTIDNGSNIIKIIEICSYEYDKIFIISEYDNKILQNRFKYDDSIIFTNNLLSIDYKIDESNYKEFLETNYNLKKLYVLLI